jgi:hypothetical protein
LRLGEHVQLAGLDGQKFGENRRNSLLRLPIRGSNPVARSDGGESFFRAKTVVAIRAGEIVPMLLMSEEFGH